jgi:hypothetical protein
MKNNGRRLSGCTFSAKKLPRHEAAARRVRRKAR